jgi:hypothetical protein
LYFVTDEIPVLGYSKFFFTYRYFFSGLVTDLDDDNNMNPLIKTEECTFAFIKHTNLYVVATTRKNSNIAMLFALLHKICQVKFNSSGRLGP